MANAPKLNLTLTPVHRRVRIFSLTEDELNTLYTAGNLKTLDVAMFSLAVGAGITGGVTLLTVDGLSLRGAVVLWSLTFVAIAAAIFFGVRSILAWRAAVQRLSELKQGIEH